MTIATLPSEVPPPTAAAVIQEGLACGPSLARKSFWARRSTKVVMSLFDQALVSGTRFLMTVAVGRFCGPDDLGVYSLVFGVLLLVVGVQEAIISVPFTVHRQRRKPELLPTYLGSVLGHSLILSIAAALVIAPLAGLLGHWSSLSEMSSELWVLAIVMPVVLVRELARRAAFSMLAVGPAVFIDLIASALQIGIVVALIGMDWLSPAAVFAALGIGSLVAFACWWATQPEPPSFELPQMRSDLSDNWAFGRWALGGQIVQVCSGYLMHWMLALLLGTQTTGHFAACMALVMMTNPIMLGISNLLVPAAAREHSRGDAGRVRSVVFKAIGLMLIVSIPFLLAVTFFGPQILTLVYGADYANESPTLILLAVATTVAVVGLATHDGLWAVNRPDVNFATSLLGVVVMMPLGFWLIPQWGGFGAACSILVGRLATSVVRGAFFIRILASVVSAQGVSGGAR